MKRVHNDRLDDDSRLNRVDAVSPNDYQFGSPWSLGLLVRHLAQFHMITGVKHRPARVLDAGCGTGASFKLMTHKTMQSQSRGVLEFWGVDGDEHAIAQARQITARPSLGEARWLCANLAHDWTWAPDDYFDVVWYTETIEHLPAAKAEHSLRELRRCLAPDGRALLSTPTPFVEGDFVWPDSHDHEFTDAQVRQMVANAGLTVVDAWGVYANWTQARSRLRRDYPDWFIVYETLRRRGGPALAQTVMQLLVPPVCPNTVYLLSKENT